MAKKAVITGEYWIGGMINRPAPQSAIEAAQRRERVLTHWLPIAEQRRDSGRRWYDCICRVYYAELAQLDAQIAAQTAPTAQRTARREVAA